MRDLSFMTHNFGTGSLKYVAVIFVECIVSVRSRTDCLSNLITCAFDMCDLSFMIHMLCAGREKYVYVHFVAE